MRPSAPIQEIATADLSRRDFVVRATAAASRCLAQAHAAQARAASAQTDRPLLQAKGDAQSQEKPIVQIPQPGVPQVITMEGKFVRASYNNEGYVILGYQASNRSVGKEKNGCSSRFAESRSALDV